jgi:defect-in-organelle-trafficking protein DotB
MDTKSHYQEEPISLWTIDDLDRFLLWAIENNASDVSLISGKPVYARIHGTWVAVTDREPSADELFMLLDKMTRNPGTSARVKGGDPDVDPPYEVKDQSNFRHRFRVNATAIRDGWSVGCNIVMRTIPAIPPSLDELNIEPELRKHLFPNNGLVLVTGVMGTGKTTLLASILRQIIEQGGRSLLTFESPIEFDLSAIPGNTGPICQMELPIHLPSFQMAARNASRRAADVILVGESRDRETFRSMLEVSEIGVAAYSTLHTSSVHDTPSRILNVFNIDEQQGIAVTMFSTLRVIIQQRLLPKVGGGRIAVRESLVFSDQDRRSLINTPIEKITDTLREMCIERKTDLLSNARILLDKELINDDTFMIIEKERS